MAIATDIKREELAAKLDIGTTVHINNEDNTVKYSAYLVGYDHGTLITSLPTTKQLNKENISYDKLFVAQQPLIIRLIVNGVIYAFKSPIMAIHLEPCQLLLNSLPEKIQTKPLRQAVRYPCVLQAGFLIGDTKYRGAVTNISNQGCLFRMKTIANITSIKAMKENDNTSNLEIQFPFDQGMELLDVKVKSILEDGENLLLGMALTGDINVVEKYIESMQLEELTEFLTFTE
ncbi:MAG: PilZ domain-containing protein [Pseudomonadales bacterium]